jgi:hypothetical protein
MNNKILYQDLKNYRDGDFRINSDLEVFFGGEQIGEICIVKNDHPEGDDEIACFLPGGISFQHYPVSDPGIACLEIYEKYYERKNRRK